MIKEKIDELLKLSEIDLGLYQFELDPLGHKIQLTEKISMIEKAIACGEDLACKLVATYGDVALEDYLGNLDISLTRKATNSGLEYIYFGTYQKPNKITIYEDNIAKGTTIVKGLSYEGLNQAEFSEVIIAHEMFHHLEEMYPELYVNQIKVPLWTLGKFKYLSPLIAPAEIASMAFAKKLLNLKFQPNILDVILLLSDNQELAEEIYLNMMAMKKISLVGGKA